MKVAFAGRSGRNIQQCGSLGTVDVGRRRSAVTVLSHIWHDSGLREKHIRNNFSRCVEMIGGMHEWKAVHKSRSITGAPREASSECHHCGAY